MRKPRVDWNKWRLRYVTGGNDVTLESLSQEAGAPSFHSLRKRCALESWSEQRAKYRDKSYALLHQDYAIEHASLQIQQLVNATEMLVRHIKYARQMQEIATRKLEQVDINKLTVREALDLLKLGIDIERLAEGLATERQSIDVSTLSDAQLEIIAYGKK